ncbi:hypothetical protein DMC30DRAFT_414121 [Rhodotorula diobovata]|uniref:Uncharacterized protein n=1 Tax=Rhodotorula diobovata TaxID=5288 RepID=A0A5C5G643_9BASI|nr:hypothetical protein DMC30DRAFT_414121 [Rhodotorula diobovata]
MPSSLLSLPDELLAHIVDQALGEYAPRLYKERQATAWALSLVNRRIGAIAQPRLVEVVHVEYEGGQGPSPSIGRLPVNGVRTLHSSHPPFSGGPLERVLAPLSLTDFDALRDLRLVRVSDLPLEQISRFNELRVLVLDHVTFNADAPFTSCALERLTLFDCHEYVDLERPELLASAGLPALRHLYLLRLPQRNRRRQLVAPGLLHQVETLGFDFRDDMVRSGS